MLRSALSRTSALLPRAAEMWGSLGLVVVFAKKPVFFAKKTVFFAKKTVFFAKKTVVFAFCLEDSAFWGGLCP